MSGLEVNKILAAIIMAVLIVTLIGHAGDLIVNIKHGGHGAHAEKHETAYKIEVPEASSDNSSNIKRQIGIMPWPFAIL